MGLSNRKPDRYTAPPLIRNFSQIGNSKGIILPQALLELLGWDMAGQVELKVDGNNLLVSPVTPRVATDKEFEKAKDHVLSKYRRLNEKLAKR